MVRRMILAAVLAASLTSVGCIAVVSNRGMVGVHRDAVVVDGQIYVVDTRDGSVKKIDSAVVQDAEPFVTEEEPG